MFLTNDDDEMILMMKCLWHFAPQGKVQGQEAVRDQGQLGFLCGERTHILLQLWLQARIKVSE